MPRQVQLHMGAIQQLLNVCQTKSVYLSDGIKRAIFWQAAMQHFLTAHSYIGQQARLEFLGHDRLGPSD